MKFEYDPAEAREAVTRDAQEFISELSAILDSSSHSSAPDTTVVVIAIDSELLGHWWREGVEWFTQVIERLPAVGIETVTLEQVTQHPKFSIALGDTSWGEGKDWRLWTSNSVRDLVVMNHATQRKILDSLEGKRMPPRRESSLLNEAVLQLSSDWAFMVSRDSAAEYGRARSQQHYSRFNTLFNDPEADYNDSLYPFSLSWPRA
jgi:1,4-alpha-glucan branching enzyme